MFEKFMKFIEYKEKNRLTSVEDFLNEMAGKSFLQGMYRFFEVGELKKWREIVENTFPTYKNSITIFSYDWLGRVFAFNNSTKEILQFDPGFGDVLSIPDNIIIFHETHMVEFLNECIASDSFYEWYDANNKYQLSRKECVGLKVPVFLGGEDDIENLEVSDMEVYWEIMMPLMNL